jgi:hypothetical protein
LKTESETERKKERKKERKRETERSCYRDRLKGRSAGLIDVGSNGRTDRRKQKKIKKSKMTTSI